jgi:hypothetical protein
MLGFSQRSGNGTEIGLEHDLAWCDEGINDSDAVLLACWA